MTATLITSTLHAFADGNAGHACALGSAPNVGEFDLLAVNSDTVVSTPSGFTLGTSNVANQGSYFFYRKAVGGEASSVTVTTSGNFNCQVSHSRWSGLNALDITAKAAATSAASVTPAVTTATLAGTGELVVAFAALHSMGAPAASAPVWSSGYTAVTGPNPQGGATSSAVDAFVGSKDGAGTAAESPSVSWTSGLASDRDILVLVFTETVSGPAPGTVAAVAAVPAATVKAIATPSTVAGTAAVPAPKLAIVVATVAGIAAVPSPTVRSVATPATVAGVATVPTPTVTTSSNSTATPATVTALASIPAPVTSVRAAPATVAGVGAIPAPVARAVAVPATVAAVAAIPTPTVVAGNAAAPGTVAAVAAIPAPTVQSSSTASPATVAAGGGVPSPTVSTGTTVTLVTVAGVAAIPAAQARVPARPDTVAAIASIPSPVLTVTGGNGELTAARRPLANLTTSARTATTVTGGRRATATMTGGHR